MVKYEKFTEANKQAMEECLPKRKRLAEPPFSANIRVIVARGNAQAAKNLFRFVQVLRRIRKNGHEQ